MAHKFKLNQRVIIEGFESHGTITTMPYNDEMETYMVTFDRPQAYSMFENSPASLHDEIVVDAQYLKAEAPSEPKEKSEDKPARKIFTPEYIKKMCRHKGITFIPHHACGFCGVSTGWYLFGRWPGMEVAYSSSCGCAYSDSARPASWNDIFKWVTDEHGELRPEYKDMLTE